MLSIIETLKEFWNVLLGQHIKVYTDHQNLTYANFNTEHIMRWWLIIEAFSPELIYLKGETNIVADALSRLEMNMSEVQTKDMHNMHYLAKHFALNDTDLSDDAYPLHYKLITQYRPFYQIE